MVDGRGQHLTNTISRSTHQVADPRESCEAISGLRRPRYHRALGALLDENSRQTPGRLKDLELRVAHPPPVTSDGGEALMHRLEEFSLELLAAIVLIAIFIIVAEEQP
jgi:hypothetical protein